MDLSKYTTYSLEEDDFTLSPTEKITTETHYKISILFI